MEKEEKQFLKLILLILIPVIVISQFFLEKFWLFIIISIIIFITFLLLYCIYLFHSKSNRSNGREMYDEYRQFYDDFYKNGKDYTTYQKRTFGRNEETGYRYDEFDKCYEDMKYEEALNMFGYKSFDFISKYDLKKKYKKLMKKAHPDNGGSAKQTQKVNEFYNMLLKKIEDS